MLNRNVSSRKLNFIEINWVGSLNIRGIFLRSTAAATSGTPCEYVGVRALDDHFTFKFR